MRQLHVRPLTRQRVAQCLPLCRLEIPALSQGHWEAYAQDHLSDASRRSPGILIAEDQRRCILGLLVHGIDHDIQHGRVLQAKWMIVQDYFPAAREEVAESLLAALEQLAEASACRSIHTDLAVPFGQPEPDWLTSVLQTRGHRHHSSRFSKTLGQADA